MQTNKEDLVCAMLSTSHNHNFGCFCKFVILRKIRGENTNKIYHVNKAMVVVHICNRNLDIQSQGYSGNKNQILMLIKM